MAPWLVTWACVLGLGCFVLTAALTPIVMQFARRIGAVDRGGYRKVYRGEMPLLGGIGIALPLVALSLTGALLGSLAVRHWKWVWLNHREWFDTVLTLAGYRTECLTLALGSVAIVGLGLVDDTRGMRARWKLLGQVAIAFFVSLSGHALTTVGLPVVGTVELGPVLGGIVTVLWIVGLINAFNLIDGIDGLATGLALVGAAALMILGLVQETLFVTLVGAALAGSLLAFLLYNFPPARIFLGDTGSMLLGYTLAVMSLIGSQKSEAAVILLAPMLALSLPLFETVVSVVRRYVGGVPIFAGDNRHTHHRLLHKGYSQPQVVLTLCGTGVVLASAAVMSALIPETSRWAWSPYALYLATLVNIAWLAGYLRPTSLRAVLERRHRNQVFQSLSRYGALCVNDATFSETKLALLLDLCRQELGLRWMAIAIGQDRVVTSPRERLEPVAEGVSGELRVKSSEGQEIAVSFEYNQPPDETMRQDVTSCLAAIFDQVRAEPLYRMMRAGGEAPRSKLLEFTPAGKRGVHG